MVKNPPASAGDARGVGSISGSGRSLEEGRAIDPSIHACRIPPTEEPGRDRSDLARTHTILTHQYLQSFDYVPDTILKSGNSSVNTNTSFIHSEHVGKPEGKREHRVPTST